MMEGFLREWLDDKDYVLVESSGSTGKPHTFKALKSRMKASARRTCEALGVQRGMRTLLCLSPSHIAGMMAVVRALECDLTLEAIPPTSHPLSAANFPPGASRQFDLVSMVPMQVENSLAVAGEAAALRDIKILLIGGAPISESLHEKLHGFSGRVLQTYGMTETLSNVALRDLRAQTDWYVALPGVTVSLDERGCLVIADEVTCDAPLVTNDLAELHPTDSGRFRILGRIDNVIISGGLKIHIEALEQTLRPLLDMPFAITKVEDTLLGEAVTLVAQCSKDALPAIKEICEQRLPKYHRPRHYLACAQLPLTATEKPAREEIRKLAAEKLGK